MKKLLLAIAFFGITSAQAQSEKYTAAMKTNLAMIDSAFKNPHQLLELANNFERIATAEKNQWLPYYYAALLQINNGFIYLKPDGYDAIADKAEKLINQADAISPKNSELSVLKSMVATMRMIVDPMTRYMQYGQEIETQIQAAIAQDENNPRPYFIRVQNLVNTPEQFGGGCKAASESLKTGMIKFENFKPASDISPNWGKDQMAQIVKQCGGK